MNLLFADYNGPTGLYVATGKDLLPLSEPAGATVFVGAGMQAGTIDPQHSAEIQGAVDSAIGSAAVPSTQA
jgi:hypothetical protein